MDEETKTCDNCKRDIPAVNFTIHSVHCARNIRMCPVCKEPFPHSELQEHHEKMHKLLPCKQCGESVCGTDLEDHVRDSCAHTMQTCRYCNLDVRRGELPAHEKYCGSRTEQCEECGEWVMLHYRKIHTDSNHGFIRLDDDPIPFRRDNPRKVNNVPKQTNGVRKTNSNNDVNTVRTEIRHFAQNDLNPIVNALKENVPEASCSNAVNGAIPKPKRTNDQPQINKASAPANKVNKNMSLSRGAIKKRPAPKPPVVAPPNPIRDEVFTHALRRQQEEERQRREQNALNLALGLPPVLTPLEKIEKLRKMDALQNRETENTDYKNKLTGRVWMSRDVPCGNVLGEGSSTQNPNNLEVERRRNRIPFNSLNTSEEGRRVELNNLTPMNGEEFIERMKELQLREPQERSRGRQDDGFSQIKTSLRELRRGLNAVTAPYISNPNVDVNRNRNTPSDDEVKLPCEFCNALVSADMLVQHQTGCRPDLARLNPRGGSSPTGSQADPPRAAPAREPVIPCEFCSESLPVYLISEHQERCGREANLLYPD